MTDWEEVRARLSELKPIYEETRKRHIEWESLQDVERAGEAFRQAVAEEDALLDDLIWQQKNLEEWRRRLGLTPGPKPSEKPIPFRDQPLGGRLGQHPVAPTGANVPNKSPMSSTTDEPALAIRRRLQKIVGRYAVRLHLSTEVVGRINRIACTDSRLGEALVLLEWRVYEEPLHSSETHAAHLARLKEWQPELAAYRDFLLGEIAAERNRQYRLLDIWEQWRKRTQDAAGNEAWEGFIAGAREKRREWIRELKAEIADAEREIAEKCATRRVPASPVQRTEE
jgi:hypothetical protein